MQWRRGIVAWLMAAALAGSGGVMRAQVERSFTAESRLSPGVDAPAEVVRLLLKDADVRDSMASEVDGRLPRGWYDATPLDLGIGAGRGLLVRGNCPLCAAHGAWFWIYGKRGGRWRLLLHVVGDGLDVMKRRTAGLRDIGVVNLTAAQALTTEYRFDGRSYKAFMRKGEKR